MEGSYRPRWHQQERYKQLEWRRSNDDRRDWRLCRSWGLQSPRGLSFHFALALYYTFIPKPIAGVSNRDWETLIEKEWDYAKRWARETRVRVESTLFEILAEPRSRHNVCPITVISIRWQAHRRTPFTSPRSIQPHGHIYSMRAEHPWYSSPCSTSHPLRHPTFTHVNQRGFTSCS